DATFAAEYKLHYLQASDRFDFTTLKSPATQNDIIANTFGSPPLSTWLFLIAWYDPADLKIRISVNNRTADVSAVTTGVQTSSLGVGVGATRPASPSNPWDGRIDECGFWQRVLSAGERTALWNGGAGITYPFS